MRQVIKHREIKLLEMIRRTDPVIPFNTNYHVLFSCLLLVGWGVMSEIFA